MPVWLAPVNVVIDLRMPEMADDSLINLMTYSFCGGLCSVELTWKIMNYGSLL
jgi:hypothetical protein